MLRTNAGTTVKTCSILLWIYFGMCNALQAKYLPTYYLNFVQWIFDLKIVFRRSTDMKINWNPFMTISFDVNHFCFAETFKTFQTNKQINVIKHSSRYVNNSSHILMKNSFIFFGGNICLLSGVWATCDWLLSNYHKEIKWRILAKSRLVHLDFKSMNDDNLHLRVKDTLLITMLDRQHVSL